MAKFDLQEFNLRMSAALRSLKSEQGGGDREGAVASRESEVRF